MSHEAMGGAFALSCKNPARIVVVEDNPADVHFYRIALDEHGEEYELEVLSDGEEAIRFVKQRASAFEIEPCVIVLDLHLPKHDGPAVVQAIRREPRLADLRIVAVTGLAAPQDEKEVLELGVRLYRTKPTDLDGWIALAGEILEVCRESSHKALA